jgi:ribonucleoside-diphosphate reductase alpha chain
VFGQFNYIPLLDLVTKNVNFKVYDREILEAYSIEEWETLDSYINHERDLHFTYAGMRQVVDKYLVQDRSNGKLYETPQFMYMMIAATLFQKYPKNTRLSYVRRYYDAVSTFKINIPTPVMSGVRTPIRQFASCVLVDVDDTLPSIFNSSTAVGYYIAQRAGIGLNMGRIRAINSKIRGGEVAHTGVIPFLKVYEAVVRSCTQNGVRGGSATVHFPIWHKEIEDVVVLKNNKGTEDNRVRKLDYSVQISKLFYERLLSGGDISLFSPHDVPGLYEAFGNNEQFDTLYVKYEADKKIHRKTVSAMQLFTEILKERAETGRIYIMNIDHVNSHSSFTVPITMSNLCQEITLPTTPINGLDGSGEIALCILSAVNVGTLRNLDDLENICELAVRALDEIIEYQGYPVDAAERSTKARRSLGVGYIGLAHYLARLKLFYHSPDAPQAINRLTEAFQYYLIKASVVLAKEKGPCEYFSQTKYSQGILPIDTYKKEVDDFLDPTLHYDWESLRADIKQYGMRHSTLSAQMPSESSSVVSNETNGIEPPRAFLSVKKSKKGPLKQIVPSYSSLKNYYTLLWDMPSNEGYFKIVAAMQKYFDQSISGNWSYNPQQYPNNEVPMSVFMTDMLMTYKWGWKTSYYHNTYDMKSDDSVEDTPAVALLITETPAEPGDDSCDACMI